MIYHQVYKFWLLSILEDFGNFKEASQHARITQSAFSQNMTSLEQTIGYALFLREKGRIEMTAEGRQLLEQIKPILKSMDKINLKVSPSNEVIGSFRLGSFDSISSNLIPSLYKKLQILYPKLDLAVTTGSSSFLTELLNDGQLDGALVVNGREQDDVYCQKMGDEFLGLFAKASQFRRMSNDNLFKLGYACLKPREQEPQYLKKFKASLPEGLKMVVGAESFDSVFSLIQTGSVVGVLPERMAYGLSGQIVKIWPKGEGVIESSRHELTFLSRKNNDNNVVGLVKNELQSILE